MQEFKSKKEVFEYITKKFKTKDVKGIVIVGSTAKGSIKQFSDIDVVVFNNKPLKPYYELCLIDKKIVLITIYFYNAGRVKNIPKNGEILYGNYFEQIEHKGNLNYNKENRIKRDNQMLLDGLFKYLRSKDKNYLKWVDKYLNI